MNALPFTKMHGLGNDYIFIDGFAHAVDDPSTLARAMSDRHLGIGGDGLILVLPPDDDVEANLRMRIFNADGGEAEMCGNGIRCLAKLAHERGLCRAAPIRIQTHAGVLECTCELDGNRVTSVTVDMGEPVVDPSMLPINDGALSLIGTSARCSVPIDGRDWLGVLVSTGNPHIVLFRAENAEAMRGPLASFDLQRWGSAIERHEAFPQRINAHFVETIARDEIAMRTWERGSGATRACGTGACAACVAGVLSGRTERAITAHLPGGNLHLRWDEASGHVFMTGPAVEAFTGRWPASADQHRAHGPT